MYRILILVISILLNNNIALAKQQITFAINTNADEELQGKLRSLAKYLKKSAESLGSAGQLSYWESEADRSFSKVLRSFGYYENLIELSNITKEGKEHNILTFDINTGDRYRIKDVKLKFVSGSNKSIKNITLDQLNTQPNDYVNANLILEDEEKILRYIEKNNCLLNLSLSHQAILDHLNDEVSIIFLVNSGPFAKVGAVKTQGLSSLKESYVQKLTGLKTGQCFKQSYIAESRKELQKSTLFLTAVPIIPEEVDEDGTVPVLFDFQERKTKNIKIGAGYGTDIGISGILGWQHRNLFGGGENLKVKIDANTKNQLFELGYQKPFFLRDNQILRIENSFEHKEEKPFDTKAGDLAIFIDQETDKRFRRGIGAQFSGLKEKKDNEISSREFYLLSIPTYMEYDQRDNFLNSKKGYFTRLDAEPFMPISLDEDPFLKTKMGVNAYYTFGAPITAACKVSTGAIFTRKNGNVPLSERFLLGGGNSVRGYGYNLIGQTDSENNVFGGNSFIELSAEMRFKLKENFGLVSFVDGGRTYDSQITKIDKLLYGYGFGLRYYTDFAPLRFDVAFPLNRRKSIDNSFQLYFGIGQSF